MGEKDVTGALATECELKAGSLRSRDPEGMFCVVPRRLKPRASLTSAPSTRGRAEPCPPQRPSSLGAPRAEDQDEEHGPWARRSWAPILTSL